MIDKQSSASGHDYASDRSAIGAGAQNQWKLLLFCDYYGTYKFNTGSHNMFFVILVRIYFELKMINIDCEMVTF